MTDPTRLEDDPDNWFLLDGSVDVSGPAVITAISGPPNTWVLVHEGKHKRLPLDFIFLGKLFLPKTWSLKGVQGNLVSGYFMKKE